MIKPFDGGHIWCLRVDTMRVATVRRIEDIISVEIEEALDTHEIVLEMEGWVGEE
jgi:hypothetical protein